MSRNALNYGLNLVKALFTSYSCNRQGPKNLQYNFFDKVSNPISPGSQKIKNLLIRYKIKWWNILKDFNLSFYTISDSNFKSADLFRTKSVLMVKTQPTNSIIRGKHSIRLF